MTQVSQVRINYLCNQYNFFMIKTDISQLEPKKNIIIKGAQVHNLKNLDVAIPRNKLVVITGLSGSGKSSEKWFRQNLQV